jgi:hypothetical protein
MNDMRLRYKGTIPYSEWSTKTNDQLMGLRPGEKQALIAQTNREKYESSPPSERKAKAPKKKKEKGKRGGGSGWGSIDIRESDVSGFGRSVWG